MSASGWKYDFADEPLENRWSYRAQVKFAGAGEIRIVFAGKNFALLQLRRGKNGVEGALFSVVDGKVPAGKNALRFVLPATRGEIGLQKIGARTRVLWNGNLVAQTDFALSGGKFGTAARGAASLIGDAPQPTEAVVFRDDFMRAQGPTETEIPGEWKTSGAWKTSGVLGPRSDAALNPNPFVFRAQGLEQKTPGATENPTENATENVARAGKWWWDDYTVSASVRALENDSLPDSKAPLRASIEAFSAGKGGVRGEIDFSRGLVTLSSGSKVLARNRVLIEASQWHRLRLEPGPGLAKFWVDGVLLAQGQSRLARGGVALRGAAGAGSAIDFDDVRAGQCGGAEWGERALPNRFQKDRLMANWASNAKSWSRDTHGIWWHTGDFFGAASVEIPHQMFEVGESLVVRLRSNPTNLDVGAKMVISRPDKSKTLSFSLFENGQFSSQQAMEIGPKSLSALRVRYVPGKNSHFRVGVETGKDFSNFIFPSKVGNAPAGTKIGIEPRRDGRALAAPSPRAMTLKAATFERESRAAIGVSITAVSPEIARQIGLPDELGAIVDHVEEGSAAQKAGVLEGDVVRILNGARVTDVDSMRAALGAVKAGQNIEIGLLRPQNGAAGLDLSRCIAATPDVLDYSFTAAPTDWRAARGTWDVAERWTCSPQWSFFSGQNDAAPLLWSRFAPRGDWTLEAYLATPMDLTRGERSPSDLNLTVGADGENLASGTSFIFAGKNRSANQIRRGDAVVWEKPFALPPSSGEVHQDWFYVRLERRQARAGVRFRYLVNGQLLADYLEEKPLPDGGHIGFWTQSGGLSIARVRLWHSGLRPPQKMKATIPNSGFQTAQSSLSNDLRNWSARGQGREVSAQLISLRASIFDEKPGEKTLQITNPQSGGDWTTFVTRSPFSIAQKPVLQWDYRVPQGVKINLYAQIGGIWREIGFTGPQKVPGDNSSSDNSPLGQIESVVSDVKWHRARFDLAEALRNQGIAATQVEALAFAAPDQDYLRAGLGGNHRGATYWIRGFSVAEK